MPAFREHPLFLFFKQLPPVLLAGIVLFQIRGGAIKQSPPYVEAIVLSIALIWFCVNLRRWHTHRVLMRETTIEYYQPSLLNSRATTSLPIEWVQNISIGQNGIGRLVQFGDLRVETAGGRGEILFRRAFRPKQAQARVFEAMRKAHKP